MLVKGAKNPKIYLKFSHRIELSATKSFTEGTGNNDTVVRSGLRTTCLGLRSASVAPMLKSVAPQHCKRSDAESVAEPKDQALCWCRRQSLSSTPAKSARNCLLSGLIEIGTPRRIIDLVLGECQNKCLQPFTFLALCR